MSQLPSRNVYTSLWRIYQTTRTRHAFVAAAAEAKVPMSVETLHMIWEAFDTAIDQSTA